MKFSHIVLLSFSTLFLLFDNRLQAVELSQQPENNYPIFNCTWTSTWGKIRWSVSGDEVTGWYGNKNKTLRGTLKKDFNGTYVLRGEWGRKNNANKKGGFSFVFDSPTSFKGTYWYEGNPTARTKWKGRGKCGSQAPAAVEKRPKYPNLECTWTSTWGDIKWSVSDKLITGSYDKGKRTLAGSILQSASSNYVLQGAWNSVDNPDEKGGFTMTFTSANSFKGNWWNEGDETSLIKWKGKCN